MARPPLRKVASRNPFSSYLGPIAIGAAYAVSKAMTIRWVQPEWITQIDFKHYLLVGFFLGIVIRPVVQRIYWYRRTSFVTLSFMLFLMGPMGIFFEYLMEGQPIAGDFWKVMLPEVVSTIMATLLASLILVPAQFQLTLKGLATRLLQYLSWNWALRIFVGAGIYVGCFLCFRVALSSLEAGEIPLNYDLFFNHSEVSWKEKLFYLWSRGLVFVLALLPVYNIVRGKPHEMALIFGTLLFVVSDLAPLVANTHGGFSYEIVRFIIQRLFIAFAFCYSLMLFFDKFPFFLIPKKREK